MADDKFTIDDDSRKTAANLSRRFLNWYDKLVKRSHDERFHGTRSREYYDESLPEGPSDVMVEDVQEDVRDFGLLSAIAARYRLRLPMLVMQEGRAVPLLPPLGTLRSSRIATAAVGPFIAKGYIRGMLQQSQAAIQVQMRHLPEVREAFFRGLKPFLVARIGGTRWLDRREKGNEHSPPGQPRVLKPGAGAPYSQLWTIDTDGHHGLSIYYGHTHACRTNPIYLNAPTSPVDVYLPIGTLFLAANSGGLGGYTWDSAMITVPSHTTYYKTKAF